METSLDRANKFLAENKGIITLVGSTRFYDEYVAANRELTLLGWVVLSCGHFGNSRHKHLDQAEVNKQAKNLHFYKLSLSDAVCVVGYHYIGSSTQRELDYARKLKLPVVLSHPVDSAQERVVFTMSTEYQGRPFNLSEIHYQTNTFQEFAKEGLGY